MTEVEVDRWTREGITAVKNGDHEQARSLFMKVLSVDDENESAWLWLSTVVESEEDQRLCLENVLAINPDNPVARRRLTALEDSVEAPASPSLKGPIIQFQQEERFDDVWSRNVDICGYCAAEVGLDANHCPQCKRKLIVNRFRYATPSPYMMAFGIALIILALVFGLQIGYSRATTQTSLLPLGSGLVMILLFLAAGGVFFRKFWAYGLAITVSVLVIILGLAQFFILPELTALDFSTVDPAIRDVIRPITNVVWVFIKALQILVAAVGLMFAFRASADFERAKYRQIAAPTKGLKRAIEYHTAAKQLAAAGLWATAVLNWQRAVALEPTRIQFQQQLGQAYARLGFIERSLDVLQAAQKRNNNPELQGELDSLIQSIQENQR